MLSTKGRLLWTGFVLCLSSAAGAQVPGTIGVQGRLASGAGIAVDGSFALTFRLFAAASGGEALWSEEHKDIETAGGAFSAILGLQDPVTGAVLLGGSAWIEVQVENEPPLPRRPLSAVPSALLAAEAEVAATAKLADNAALLEGKSLSQITADILAKVEDEVTPKGNIDQSQLPSNGLNEVSNDLLSNQFVDESKATDTPKAYNFGVTSQIQFPDVGSAEKLTVSVSVSTDGNLGGTIITLTDPAGASYTLFDKGGGNAFAATFPDPVPTVSGDLTTWVGKNPLGLWDLKISDTNGANSKLEAWSIKIQTLSTKKVALNGDLIIKGKVTGEGGLTIDGDLNLGGNQILNARLQLSASPPFACDASKLGAIYLDTTDNVIRVCIDGEFQAVASGVCGDGKVQGAEECDDGDALGGDGCNAACQIEPGFTCAGLPSSCAAQSCLIIKSNNPAAGPAKYLIDPNGGSPVDAFEVFCNMDSPTPDYQLITPDQFYHGDNTTKYGNTNGVNVFNYSCDACGTAKQPYEYTCADSNWQVHTFAIRSHCDKNNHTADTVFKATQITKLGLPGLRFEQFSDDCGDPNEMTIIGVCRIKGTTAPDPADWNKYFRNVSWSN